MGSQFQIQNRILMSDYTPQGGLGEFSTTHNSFTAVPDTYSGSACPKLQDQNGYFPSRTNCSMVPSQASSSPSTFNLGDRVPSQNQNIATGGSEQFYADQDYDNLTSGLAELMATSGAGIRPMRQLPNQSSISGCHQQHGAIGAVFGSQALARRPGLPPESRIGGPHLFSPGQVPPHGQHHFGESGASHPFYAGSVP